MNAEGFDDEQIARAIAQSLQDLDVQSRKSTTQKKPVQVIEISDNEDEEEQSRAQTQKAILTTSKSATSSETHSSVSNTPAPEVGTPEVEPPPPKQSNTFLFDRAQMERERIARQKRLRPDPVNESPPEKDDEHDSEGEDEEVGTRSVKRQRTSPSSRSATHANATSSSARTVIPKTSCVTLDTQAASTNRSRGGDTFFWEGELRQTANMHVEKIKDTRPLFRLTEILSPRDEINFAIISAYVINWSWIYSLFNPNTPVIAVAQDPQGNETIKEVLPNWIKTTPYLRGGYGCMHMKFMLLFYKSGRLRVMISTANLIEYDWRDIENSVWVQDIPLRSSPIVQDSKATDFPASFIGVLKGLNVLPALLTLNRNGHENLPITRLDELRTKWDFVKVTVHLVPSMAGKHETWPRVIQTGHTALMKALRDLGLRRNKGEELVLECQGSSIGKYTAQWVNEFYLSARGESAEEWLDKKKRVREQTPYPSVKILFPTLTTVRESILGEGGGGTMFCRRNMWEVKNYPRSHFYDSRSKRGKVLMHSKMILGIFSKTHSTDTKPVASSSRNRWSPLITEGETESEDPDIVEVTKANRNDGAIGWLYVGSHNFTPSAWGTLSGSGFNPILNITNYELGVVFPIKNEIELERYTCWERPPRKYVLGEDEPWIQDESTVLAAAD